MLKIKMVANIQIDLKMKFNFKINTFVLNITSANVIVKADQTKIYVSVYSQQAVNMVGDHKLNAT